MSSIGYHEPVGDRRAQPGERRAERAPGGATRRYLLERQAELRSSETRFRAMSDASPLGSFVFDVQRGASTPTRRITRYPG